MKVEQGSGESRGGEGHPNLDTASISLEAIEAYLPIQDISDLSVSGSLVVDLLGIGGQLVGRVVCLKGAG